MFSLLVSQMEWCRQQNVDLISLLFFSDLPSLNSPPIMCIVVHNFRTCTPTTKVPVSLTFRFPGGVVVSETWNSEERSCLQSHWPKLWHDWVVPVCSAYCMFLLFLPSFKKNLIGFFCHSIFSLSTRLEVIFYVCVLLKVTLASSACIVKKV